MAAIAEGVGQNLKAVACADCSPPPSIREGSLNMDPMEGGLHDTVELLLFTTYWKALATDVWVYYIYWLGTECYEQVEISFIAKN